MTQKVWQTSTIHDRKLTESENRSDRVCSCIASEVFPSHRRRRDRLEARYHYWLNQDGLHSRSDTYATITTVTDAIITYRLVGAARPAILQLSIVQIPTYALINIMH